MTYEDMPRDQLLALLKERTEKLEAVSEELQREISERRQAERSLSEQLHFMQLLIDTIPNPVFYKDTDGIFQGCNTAYENYIGLTKDQIVGRNVYQVYPEDLAKIYYEKDRSLFNNPGLQVYQTSFRVANGSRRDIIFNKATYTNNSGVLAGLVGVISDITELKRTGEKLRKGNILYQALLRALPVGLLQLDIDGLCIKINEQASLITGYPEKELTGLQWAGAIHARDREKVLAKWAECLSKDTLFKMEYRLVRPDGRVVWVICRIAPVRGDDGDHLGYVVALSDINELKLAEEALRLSEERFSKAFNSSPSMMTISTLADGRFLDANDSLLDASGYTREEIIGRTANDLNLWVDTGIREKITRVLKKQKTIRNLETRVRAKSGEVRDGLVSASLIELNGDKCLLVAVNDITELKQAQEALKAQRQWLYSLLNELPAFISLMVPGNEITFANRLFREKFGDPRGKSCYEIYLGRSEPCKVCQCSRVLETGRPLTLEKTTGDGCTYQVHYHSCLDIDGSPRVLVMGTDITELKQLEEELSHSEAYYRSIINSAIDGFVVLDLDTNIVDANPQACAMYGYSHEEFLKHNARDMVHPDYHYLFDQFKDDMNAKGFFQAESVDIRKDGTAFPVEIKGIMFNYKSEKRILTVNRDITERKQLEKELVRLDRLNLVGEMAAGIGHEIRNPMTTVRGFLQMLREKQECHKYRDYYNLMIEELDRANGIIVEYLSLAKNKIIEPKRQSINSIISNILPLIQADTMKADKNIALELGEIPELLLDEKEIRQLILNLALNGLEAMSPGSYLTMSTYLDKDQVVLAVKDSGSGIGQDILEKLGTPFFTTKENGTGLGLAVCYSIAARHSAAIQIATSSRGTVFNVRFKQQKNN